MKEVIVQEGPGDLRKLFDIPVLIDFNITDGLFKIYSTLNQEEIIAYYGWQDLSNFHTIDKELIIDVKNASSMIFLIDEKKPQKLVEQLEKWHSASAEAHPDGVESSAVFFDIDHARAVIINIVEVILYKTREIISNVKEKIEKNIDIEDLKSKSQEMYDSGLSKVRTKTENFDTSEVKDKTSSLMKGGLNKIKSIDRESIKEKGSKFGEKIDKEKIKQTGGKIGSRIDSLKQKVQDEIAAELDDLKEEPTESSSVAISKPQKPQKVQERMIHYAAILTDQDIKNVEEYINDNFTGFDVLGQPFELLVHEKYTKNVAYQFILSRDYLSNNTGIIAQSVWHNVFKRKPKASDLSIVPYNDGYLAIEWIDV
ncbi:MAG: hypothetical protein INQ03_15690 [Candidatus Heimdallarchaeota archaeon]|nr:hypothetical protein [Candidatus Heimdallarchaeota archaeon]